MRMKGVNCSAPTACSLLANSASAAVTTLSTMSSSVMVSLASTSAASGSSICHSSFSTFSSPGMSHCSSRLCSGTWVRTTSVIALRRRLAICSSSVLASRISLRCW